MLYFSVITLCVWIFIVIERLLYQVSVAKNLQGVISKDLSYTLTEVLLIAGVLTLPLSYLASIDWFYYSVIAGYAVLLSYTDIRYHKLSDALTLSLLIFGLMLNKHNILTEFYLAVAGALVGYLFLLVIHIIYRITAKRSGIGLGDAKLLAGIGAIVGLKALPITLFIACFSCLVTIFLRKKIFGIQLNESIFYAPFLMVGLFIVLI